jgi:hypothetical protein
MHWFVTSHDQSIGPRSKAASRRRLNSRGSSNQRCLGIVTQPIVAAQLLGRSKLEHLSHGLQVLPELLLDLRLRDASRVDVLQPAHGVRDPLGQGPIHDLVHVRHLEFPQRDDAVKA